MKQTGKQVDKRTAILEAATHLFLSNGLSDTSMDAVAERANVSKQTIYSHFQNKENLFMELMNDMCTNSECPMSNADTFNASPKEVLTTVGNSFLSMITSQQGSALFRFVIAESSRSPKIAEIFYQNGPQKNYVRLAEYFETLNKEGSFNIQDPQQASINFFSMIQGKNHLKSLLNMPAPTDNEIQQHVRNTVSFFIKSYQNN